MENRTARDARRTVHSPHSEISIDVPREYQRGEVTCSTPAIEDLNIWSDFPALIQADPGSIAIYEALPYGCRLLEWLVKVFDEFNSPFHLRCGDIALSLLNLEQLVMVFIIYHLTISRSSWPLNNGNENNQNANHVRQSNGETGDFCCCDRSASMALSMTNHFATFFHRQWLCFIWYIEFVRHWFGG